MTEGVSHPVAQLDRQETGRFASDFAHKRPVVLRDAVAADHVNQWEPASLRTRAGSLPVTVNIRERHFDFERWRVAHERDDVQAEEMMHLQRMPLAQALGQIFGSGNSVPKGDMAITCLDCDMLDDPENTLETCPLAINFGCVRPTLWAAGPPRRHQAHFDPGDVFIVVMHGSKRLVLASPESSEALYPYSGHLALSRIPDLLDVAIADWPLFGSVDLWTTELRPRDVLYIPKGWWHQADYLAPSVSLSFWP